MKNSILLISLIFLSSTASAANYKYNELAIKDYDEINAMVQKRVKKAREIGHVEDEAQVDERAAIEELRDALKLLLSRPNSDNMIAKLNPEVRRELVGYSAYDDTMSSIVAEALDAFKNEKGSINQRTTSLYIIENALSEMKPEIGKSAELRAVVERVRDAKIKVPKDVIKELRLNSMVSPDNPSKQAAQMLKSIDGKK